MGYLIDTDILYAYLDSADWLHSSAVKFFDHADRNELAASSVTILELAVVVKRELPSRLFEILAVVDDLNVKILPVNREITDLAFEFVKKGFGIFDAYHAATAEFYDLVIVSTDHKYRDAGLKVVDPREG